MNEIAKPLKWSTLEDAAAYLSALTGEEWTTRRVLDAGGKGHLTICAVLPIGTRLRAGNKQAYSGKTVKLDSHYLGDLLTHESIHVNYTHDTDQHSKFTRVVDLELRPSAIFSAVHLRVADTALEEFSKTVTLRQVPSAVRGPASGFVGRSSESPNDQILGVQSSEIDSAVTNIDKPIATTRTHKINCRSNGLTSVIAMATEKAVDANDASSVWESLRLLAAQKDCPAPLLGVAENGGVEYRGRKFANSKEAEVDILTRKNFGDRFLRARAR
jgi:hypothetical protein